MQIMSAKLKLNKIQIKFKQTIQRHEAWEWLFYRSIAQWTTNSLRTNWSKLKTFCSDRFCASNDSRANQFLKICNKTINFQSYLVLLFYFSPSPMPKKQGKKKQDNELSWVITQTVLLECTTTSSHLSCKEMKININIVITQTLTVRYSSRTLYLGVNCQCTLVPSHTSGCLLT